MKNVRDFFNCANCRFGSELFAEKSEDKKCKMSDTRITPNGVCSYYMWDNQTFESRKLTIVDKLEREDY